MRTFCGPFADLNSEKCFFLRRVSPVLGPIAFIFSIAFEGDLLRERSPYPTLHAQRQIDCKTSPPPPSVNTALGNTTGPLQGLIFDLLDLV